MYRRQTLVALGTFLAAGCLGAKRPDTTAGVRIESEPRPGDMDPAAAEAASHGPVTGPTGTPGPEPETSGSETTEADVDTGDEAVARVQSELVAAVEAYTGDADRTLVETPLVPREFDVRRVLLALDAVQRALDAAEAAAATDDQRRTVTALREAEQFLTRSALTHSYFVECVDRLDDAHTAFVEGVDEGAAVESRFDRALERGTGQLAAIEAEVAADLVAVAEPFGEGTYSDMVAAFESVRGVLDDASAGLDRLRWGVGELAAARDAADAGDDAEAGERAEEARRRFDGAYDRFDDAVVVADDADAGELTSALEALRTFADGRYREADDLYANVA